ncbi:MAG: glycosyltransferase family 2 protein [Acidilobaceae archaeon]|jgi:glycosyltransferase involved in cell wall biosynthesis
MKRMIFSIIVSTKNNVSVIGFVVRSICSAAIHLNLRCNVASELVLVDGMSKDGTIEKAYKEIKECKDILYDVKILKDPGVSLSFSRKVGVEHSRGDIIMFLDGDIILSRSFGLHLCKYIERAETWDALIPHTMIAPLEGFSETFDILVTRVIQKQTKNIFPRIVKATFIRGKPFLGLLSRFWGEDLLLLHQLRALKARILSAKDLVVYKYEESSFINYWRKHLRYGEGMQRDLDRYARRILLRDLVLRRLSYIDVFFPVLSLYTFVSVALALRGSSLKDSIVNGVRVSLLRYSIKLAMAMGEIKSKVSSYGD